MHISAQIRQHIFSMEEGKLFSSRLFHRYGRQGVVDQNLARLTRRGVIVRIAHGIYMRETDSGWRPTPTEFAAAKARFSCKEIYPCPEEVMQKHNMLSPNNPADLMFYCSGGTSSFMYNNLRIFLKGNCPGKLSTLKAIATDFVIELPLPRNSQPINLAPEYCAA